MAVSMIGPKFYAWDRNGNPLAFGKVYTYQARTNTPKVTYQSEDGTIENTNPVILNGEGYANIYLNGSYKIVLKDSDDNEIWSADPVSSSDASEWISCLAASYISSTSLKVSGNFTSEYEAGRRVRINSNDVSFAYSTIESSVFAAGETTISVRDPVVTTDTIEVCRSIIGPESLIPEDKHVINIPNIQGVIDSTRINDGDAVLVKERSLGKGGSGFWDIKKGSLSNGLDLIPLSGSSGLYAELRKSDIINAKQFGDITTNAKNIIERMVASGNNIYLPSGQYDATSLDVITINKKIVIHGDTPSYDPITGEKKGTWINGVLSSAGADSIAMFDVGIDARTTATNEGIVFSNASQYLDTVFLDRVIVIAKQSANHCLLIENTKRVDVGTVLLYGGGQGFAIKSVVFNIGAIFAFDQTTWGCTVRYSPNAPCSNGYLGFVYCGTVNNAKSGGVICMNDQSGAALKNITFDKIIIEQGNSGFYITNGGNSTAAENITVNDIYIEGVSDFAIQTFGSPNGFKINKAHLKNCAGILYNNLGDPQDHEYRNFTIEGGGAPALISGDNHICSGWSAKGPTLPGAFIQNESKNLQVFGFDGRVSSVINQNGGTEFGGGTIPTSYPANGDIPAMVSYSGVKVQKNVGGVVQNGLITLYTLPASSAQYMMRLQVTMRSQAGTHSRAVEMAQEDINYIASSSFADAVFSIERNGDDIQLKYIFATTSNVSINAVIDAFHEQS